MLSPMSAWHFSPQVCWDKQVHGYFSASFGDSKLDAISRALCRPSLKPSIRVNTLHFNTDEVARALRAELQLRELPRAHAALPSTLLLNGSGPIDVDYSSCGGREVIVNRYAGEAVLRGAQVYAPGLLAASAGCAASDLVGVSVALEKAGSSWCGIPRGHVLGRPGGGDLGPERSHLFLGVGRLAAGRRALFRNQTGLAVEMTQRVFEVPSLNGVLPGQLMFQALPSIAAAQALAPEPGSRVLDMCAAPGGKTTMLAQMMEDRGQVLALDRTHAKVAEIASIAASFGLTCICPIKADATQAVRGWSKPGRAGKAVGPPTGQQGSEGDAGQLLPREEDDDFEGFEPESFDHILLDPPCSALGLRPRLVHAWTLQQLLRMADYQRSLLHAAVALLKPGGTLVYSTCTINPAENEANVRYALDRWGGSPGMGGCSLCLVPSEPLVGGRGLTKPVRDLPQGGGQWLSDDEAALVQRFDPADPDLDTMGFFIAKFKKHASLP